MMILITGDIHGEVHRVAEVVTRFGLGSNDTVVLLGDVGMNYFSTARWLSRRACQAFSCCWRRIAQR